MLVRLLLLAGCFPAVALILAMNGPVYAGALQCLQERFWPMAAAVAMASHYLAAERVA